MSAAKRSGGARPQDVGPASSGPERLADVLGQDEAVRVLEGFCRSDRFPSALLFLGPPSVGKLKAARALGWVAGCDTRAACGSCPGCRANAYGEGLRVLDLGAVFADEAVKVKVDALRAFLSTQEARHAMPRRIAVIERAELLNDAMQGSLLKAIEEPPPRVTYVLVAQTASTLASTIRSRALSIRFRSLNRDALQAIIERLGPEGPAPSPELLGASQGSVARALSLRAEYETVSEMVAEILEKVPGRGAKRADVQDKLALAVPAAAALHPAWRDALLALDAAVAANAHLGLAWGVFRAATEQARAATEQARAATEQARAATGTHQASGGIAPGRDPDILRGQRT